MKCFRYFSFVLFSLLGVFFGSFIINQNNTYAVDDITYTFDSSSSGPTYLCGTNFTPYCSDYSYLIINYEGTSLSNYVDFITFVFFPAVSNAYNNLLYSVSTLTVIDISSIDYQIRADLSQGSSSYITSGSVVTITLSENNPYVSGITPSGSIELTENGTYDVTNYAEAVVNVLETDCPPGAGGNYHEDLVAINNSIMICAATCLVIYFFYCIYRMIIKNSGVK